MSEIRFTVCDWCSRQIARTERTDLYQLGWRSLTWMKSEHMCPACVAASIDALKVTKAQRIVDETKRPVDINTVQDPLEWEKPK